jgi:iron(II)-dependent oxidoreductase
LVGLFLLLSAGLTTTAFADPSPPILKFTDEQVYGPATPNDFPNWIAAMRSWRSSTLTKMKFNGTNFTLPQLQWEHSSFIQPQMMAEDRYFFDHTTGKYTVDKYLADLNRRYGGIDSVLVWPTYPNMGIDDRNTDDMMRSMPGGVPGVRKMVEEFHKAHVRVLFPIHPWDVGTRDPDKPWGVLLPASMTAVDGDGLNGDTMFAVTKDYFDSSIADHHLLALEPELGLAGGESKQLAWNTMSWGYWTNEAKAPLVSTYKWLEPSLMVNVCDRWVTDKTGLIQSAFFNGCGIETWENVFGVWNGMTARDSEAVRRVATIERAFPDLLMSRSWVPFAPVVQYKSVYASKWPDGNSHQALWTMVNRSNADVHGSQLIIPNIPNLHYYDLWHGVELTPKVEGRTATLSFTIEANGYGAILASQRPLTGAKFSALLEQMRALSAKPLSSFSANWSVLQQTLVPVARTAAADAAPQGMVLVPGGEFDFKVNGIECEGSDPGVDFQYPWEPQALREHDHKLTIKSFYIDRYPVTNSQFKTFIVATKYHPIDDFDFLKDWKHGSYPAGWAMRPVTWVSIEDARAYAAWALKRLPHEWEWQYAAQGSDGRLYPWGNTWDATKVPSPDKGRLLTMPALVTSTNDPSPFGVMDMVGNVWQWTDEYYDQHTRAAGLRGGSYYQPQGSGWYFPQAYRLDQHGKYLLMSPGRDRSGTVGFRCAVDAGPEAPLSYPWLN